MSADSASTTSSRSNGKSRQKRESGEGDASVKKKSKKEAVQKAEVAPELVVKPRRQFTDEGSNAKFKASFDGSSSTSLFWSKDGNVLSGDDHFKIYEADGFHFLEVDHVLAEDSGIYTVTVQNLAGSDSASAELEVFVKPKLLSKSGPEWEQPLVDILVNEKDEGVELTCITKDLTKPTAKWFHNGKEVFSGFHMKLSHVAQTTTLTIKEIRKSDSGEFKCIMAGANNTLETSCVLTVKEEDEDDVEPPTFVRELHDLEVQEGDKLELEVEVKEVEHPEAPEFVSQTRTLNCHEGQSATFTCQVKGHPMPTVMWEKGGVVLSPCQKYKMTQIKDQHTLTVYDIEQADAGVYTCHLRNMVGEKASNSVLNMKQEETTQHRAEAVSKLKSRLNHLRELHSDHNNSAMDPNSYHVQVASDSEKTSNRTSTRDNRDVKSSQMDRDSLFSTNETRNHDRNHHRLVQHSRLGHDESYVSNRNQSPSRSQEKIFQSRVEVNTAPEIQESSPRMVNWQTESTLMLKDFVPSRHSETQQNTLENRSDFRSLLHKSQRPDDKVTKKENLNREEVTDFRSVLKSKQRPSAPSHAPSQVKPTDPDFRQVLSKGQVRKDDTLSKPLTRSKEAERIPAERYSRTVVSADVHHSQLTSSLTSAANQHDQSALRTSKIDLSYEQMNERIHSEGQESRQRGNLEQNILHEEESVGSASQDQGLTDHAESQEKYMASLNLQISSPALSQAEDSGTVGTQGQYKAVPVELLETSNQRRQSHVNHSESQQSTSKAFSVTVLSPGLAIQMVPQGGIAPASVNFIAESHLLQQQPQKMVETKFNYISTNVNNEIPNLLIQGDKNSNSGHISSESSPKVERKVSYIEFQPKAAKFVNVSSSVIHEPRTFSAHADHLKSSEEDMGPGPEGNFEEYDEVFSETSGTHNLPNSNADPPDDEKEDVNSMTMHEAIFANSQPKHVDLEFSQSYISDNFRRQHRSTDDTLSDNFRRQHRSTDDTLSDHHVNFLENSHSNSRGEMVFSKKTSDVPDRSKQISVLTHKSVGDDGSAEFKFVKLRPSARKMFTASEANRSKNLSKSTESLFLNVKLKPVGQIKDKGWTRSQMSSNLERNKAKWKSSDFADLPGMTTSPRAGRRFPVPPAQEPNQVTQPMNSKSTLDKALEVESRKSVPVDFVTDAKTNFKQDGAGEESSYAGVGLEEKVTVALTPKYREEINIDMTLTQGGLNKSKHTPVTMRENILNERPLPAVRKTLGAVGKSMSNEDILGNNEKSDKGPSWVKLRSTEKRFSLQIEQPPVPSYRSANETRGRQSMISNYQQEDSTSQKWSRSKGNLDPHAGGQKANNFESKKELFKNLEQRDNTKTHLGKNAKGYVSGRLASGGRHDMSPRRSSGVVKRYSGHHEAKPEWLNRKPVKNIEQRIRRADKGNTEVKTAPWVKDIMRRDVKTKQSLKENQKAEADTTKTTRPADQRDSRRKVSPKVPPPVAPKPTVLTNKIGLMTRSSPQDRNQQVDIGDASEKGDVNSQPKDGVASAGDHKIYSQSPDNVIHRVKTEQPVDVALQVPNGQALQEASAEAYIPRDDCYKASMVVLTPVSHKESFFVTSETETSTTQREQPSSSGKPSADLNRPWEKQTQHINLEYPHEDKDSHGLQDTAVHGIQEVLRASMEDLESVISVSSTASEASNVTNDSNYSSEDTCRTSVIEQLHLNETMRLNQIQERLEQTQGAETSGQSESEADRSAPGAIPRQFNNDQILHKRDESSSSQDSGLILDGAVKPHAVEVGEMETSGDKSKDSDTFGDFPLTVRRGRKFTDQEQETTSTSNAGRSDYIKDSSLRKRETTARQTGSNLETSDKSLSPWQHKLEGHERVQQYRSKFRETKNVERIELISSDQQPDLIVSTKTQPISASARDANETREDSLKARLRSKFKNIDYDSELSNNRYELQGRASVNNKDGSLEDTKEKVSHVSGGSLENQLETPSRQSKTEVTRSQGDRDNDRVQSSSGVKRPSDLDLKSSPRSSRLQVRESKNFENEAFKKTDVGSNSLLARSGIIKASQEKVTPTSSTGMTSTNFQTTTAAQPTTEVQPTAGPPTATTAPVPVVQPRCPPSFPLLLADTAVKYGSRTILLCKLAGNPKPDIKWLLNLTPIQESSNVVISYENDIAQLTILETFNEHTGDYMCWAKNPLGSISTHCQLTLEASSKSEGRALEGPVSLKPRIVSLTPSHARLVKGSQLTLTLEFVGEPSATVQWFLNGRELQTDGRVEIVTDKHISQLTIQSVGPSDAGTMSVCVSSAIGSDQTQANIHIEDVPGAPEGKPQVYDISKTSASLSWYPPLSDGGSPVTYYVIEAKTRQQTTWDVLVPQCKELSHHIFDLKQSTTYQFRVRASNKHGLGPSSEPSDRVITTDPFRPISDEESEDELPFEPRTVTINTKDKFEDLYDLENEVGKGKFGIVYKCKQKKDGTTWAAKVLRCREKDKANIKEEITIMNCLRHPKLLMLWDAFEDPRRVILVMEYVGAGELFERVIGEDFVLTERDCVHFLRQICEGVAYMHSCYILHLDLKPENILCVAENSNRIKIIDFGLARSYKPGQSAKVLFGTPEFIAPEVINYDEIDFHTDMWSIGVICYVLLSGLSPFLGDNDAETLSNVTEGEFDFEDDAFDEISDLAKDFISKLLVKKKEHRMLTTDCLSHGWLNQDEVDGLRYKRLNTERLKRFMVRRKWMKTGKAILAVGRMRRSTSSNNLSRSSSNDSLLDSCSATTPITEQSSESFDNDSSRDVAPVSKVKATVPDSTHEATPQMAQSPNDNSLSSSASENSSGKQSLNNIAQTTVTVRDSHSQSQAKKELPPLKRDQNDNSVMGNSSVLNTTREQENPIDLKPTSKDQTSSAVSSNPSPVSSNPSPAPARRNAGKIIPSRAQAQTVTPDNTAQATPDNTAQATPDNTAQATPDNTAQAPCRPVFIKSMNNCKACAGDVARFDVILSGEPTPVVTWYLDEEQITQDHRHTLDFNSSTRKFSLIIRSIVEDDEGEYMCKAVNSEGEVTCTAELSVLEM